jgi:sensor c-di-GMP phosphodiesterase-like protein
MLAMTETLGFPVVVEGVETECQLLFLESTGKPMTVQGFYFGRAVSAATVAALMAAEESKTAVINMYGDMFGDRLVPFVPNPGTTSLK